MPTKQVLGGVLNADGTLELDEPPRLPAGRVEIVLHSLTASEAAGEDWWEYLQRARGEAVAKGQSIRTEQEIETERDSFREGDDRIAGASTGHRLGA